MAKQEFNCNTEIGNVANADCPNEFKSVRRFILCPLVDSDGDAVEFANVAAFTKTNIQALLDASKIGDRIFPSALLSNVESPEAEVK